MTEYLIALNNEWVGGHRLEQLREKSRALRCSGDRPVHTLHRVRLRAR